jgi:hypothetical protein
LCPPVRFLVSTTAVLLISFVAIQLRGKWAGFKVLAGAHFLCPKVRSND